MVVKTSSSFIVFPVDGRFGKKKKKKLISNK